MAVDTRLFLERSYSRWFNVTHCTAAATHLCTNVQSSLIRHVSSMKTYMYALSPSSINEEDIYALTFVRTCIIFTTFTQLVRFHCLYEPWLELKTPQSITRIESAKAQICRTKAKPQQIVATRLLYCLQHPVLFKSSTKDSPPPIFHFNSWTSNTSLSANATKPTRYGSQPKPI